MFTCVNRKCVIYIIKMTFNSVNNRIKFINLNYTLYYTKYSRRKNVGRDSHNSSKSKRCTRHYIGSSQSALPSSSSPTNLQIVGLREILPP